MQYDRQGPSVLAGIAIDDAGSWQKEYEYIMSSLINSGIKLRPTPNMVPPLIATEGSEEELQQAWDDVSGRELDAAKVRKARANVASYIRKANLHTEV